MEIQSDFNSCILYYKTVITFLNKMNLKYKLDEYTSM